MRSRTTLQIDHNDDDPIARALERLAMDIAKRLLEIESDSERRAAIKRRLRDYKPTAPQA